MTVPQPIKTHPMIAQWVSFCEDRKVGILTGRVELGQGISAALVRIAATELGLEEGQINLISGDTNLVPNEGPTVGSLSVQVGGMALRYAASAARWECLTRAGALLQTPSDMLDIDRGSILKDGLETGLTYWSLTETAPLEGRVADLARLPAHRNRRAPQRHSRRMDMLARLRGEAFIHDLVFADMLHGRIVHPPFGATGLQASEAEVRAISGNDIGLFLDGLIIGVTAPDEHVVAKAATRLRDGLEWQVPAQADPNSVLSSRDARETVFDTGPLPEVPPTAQVSLTRPCIAHASIGACCAIAHFSGKSLQVWSHSQGVFALRDALAEILCLSPQDVVVRHVPGAGSYGHNGADDVALDAALLARANPGRHIRVIWSRSDEFLVGPLSPAMKTSVRAWLSSEGDLESIDISVTSPAHSTRPLGATAPNLRAAAYLSTPTAIQDAIDPPTLAGGGSERNATPLYTALSTQVRKHVVRDIPYRPSAFRGLGAQVNVAVIEGAMDELAGCANVDPVSFRLAHLRDPRARAVVERARDMAKGLDCDDGRARGLGFARYKNTSGYFAIVVEVLIDEDIRPTRIWAAADMGEVIDICGAQSQIEGGILQSLSIALIEEIKFDSGKNVTRGWEDYPILEFDSLPDIQIAIADRVSEPPLGCGEITMGPTTAALLNAVARGLGVRPSALPITRENLVRALSE